MGFCSEVIGLILLNVFINDLEEMVNSMLIKFSEGTKLGGVVNGSEDNEII